MVKKLSVSPKSSDIASTLKSKKEDLTTRPYIQRPLVIKGFEKLSPIEELEKLLDKKFSRLNIKPINLSNAFADKMESTPTTDLKNQTKSELNKLRGMIRK